VIARSIKEERILNEVDAEEGIRQGLEDARQGRLRPVREFFAEFEAAHPELVSKRRHPRPA
jgi:predicted transcriptional regulator